VRWSNGQLFVLAVAIWGTTWHAIVYQVAAGTPELGVTLRFALAGALALGYARWRGDAVRQPWAMHRRYALQGAFMYSLSYLCVYHAERHVPSGLVAVGYSASPLLAGLGSTLLWRTAVTRRFVAGGLLGIAGVAAIFAPELGATGARPQAGLGIGFTIAAVLLSAIGSLATSRNVHHGAPFWPAMGWAMLYGAALSALTLFQQPQALPGAPSWWFSLVYLAVAGSVVAFAAYLTLQDRIGPGKASTIGVMTPVVALVVSTAFEGYVPGAWTCAGAALAIAGNWLMLRR
jgi:drug/metabolite transporter (DMT)-like permease